MTLVVRCTHDSDLEIELPELGERLGGLEVRGKGTREERELEQNRIEHTLTVALVSFVPGPFAVPGLAVKWKDGSGKEGEERTPELFLRVLGPIEGKATLDDLKDAYPPVPLQWRPPSAITVCFWMLVLAGAASGAFLLLKAHLRRRRWKKAFDGAVLPHERALKGLDALASALPEAEHLEEHFVRLSGIVRLYIERSFGIRAPERTTEEFLEEAASDDRLGVDHRTLLREFLGKCDLIKFARYEPAVREAEEALSAARRFVDETRPSAARAQEMRARLAREALGVGA